MAVIEGPVPPDVVHSTRGTLDYAVWRGIPYVRSWPRRFLQARSAPVQASAEAFASFSRRVQSTSPLLVAGLPTLRTARLWTWKDAVTTAIYGNLYGPPQTIPPQELDAMPANEIRNFPSIERATAAKPEWWANGASATLTETTAALAGITATYPRVLKVVTTAIQSFGHQLYTYTDEPRLAAAQPIVARCAVWAVAGASARIVLQTSVGPLTQSIATTVAGWTILDTPAAILNGTTLDLRLQVDTGTAYFVPLGLSVGTTPLALPPRQLVPQWADPANIVTLTGAVDPNVWTDLDITALTHPLAARAQIKGVLGETASNYALYVRRKGSAQAATSLSAIAEVNAATTWQYSHLTIPLSDSQVFQYLLDRLAGVSALDFGVIDLWGWEQWG